MLELLRIYFQYNRWGTDRIMVALARLSPAQYTLPGCSSHGSIRDTLSHLFSAQSGWISWLDGSLPYRDAVALRIPAAGTETVEAAHQSWQRLGKQIDAYLGGLSEGSLTRRREIVTDSRDVKLLTLGEILLSVANHGTHTRAQIIAAVGRCGVDPGQLDLITFLLDRT